MAKGKNKKDPFLSELDDLSDFEGTPVSNEEDIFPEDEPTRLDVRIPPLPMHDEEEPFGSVESTMVEPKGEEVMEEAPEDIGSVTEQELLNLAPDISVPLVVVMGQKTFSVKDLLNLQKGQVLDLERAPMEPVDLVAAGKVIAKGELVEVEGKLGIRILKLFR